MANNIFQVKRTSTSGRTPNTTNSSNTQYINAGEFALNMTDQILFTSDGTNLIRVGSNQVSQSVGTLTVNAISAGGTLGLAGQVLTTNSSAVYWSTAFTGTANNTNYVGSVSAANVVSNAQLSSNLANYQTTAGLNANIASYLPTYTGTVNGSVIQVGTTFVANSSQLTITTPLSANGGVGTAGYVLTSNGATGSPYWAVSSAGVNVAAQYTWTNTQTFSNTITFNGSILANTVNAVSHTTGSYGNTSTGGSTVNTTIFAVGNSSSNAWVNSTGLYINGYVVANSTGAVNALNVGGVPAANVLYNYSNQTIQDYKTFANTIVITGALQDGNNSVGGAGQVLYSNGAGVYWGVAGGGGGGNSTIVTVSGTAPLSPTVGQLWFNTVDGNLKVYNYSNGYYQWVDSALAGNPTYNVNQNKQAIAFSLVFGGF